MKKVAIFVSFTALAIALSGLARAQTPKVQIETEYLMTIDLTFGAPNNVGQRVVVDVPSGQVKGPKIQGAFIPPSGD